MTKIWRLKIVKCAVSFLFLLILGVFAIKMWQQSTKESELMDIVTIIGPITPETFSEIRDFMINSSRAHKRLIIDSSGGDGEAALAIGMLVHKFSWDVEVRGECSSACANFIFPAGKIKYLNETSVLLFHGGPYQENHLEYARQLDKMVEDSDSDSESKSLGVPEYEGQLHLDNVVSENKARVREFLSLKDFQSIEEQVLLFRKITDRFYQEIGVSRHLPSHGQNGTYKDVYHSYKYKGFTYSLDSLKNLGMNNIVVLGGQWRPEKSELYAELYEVTYP
jgi:hypothetical protein